MGSFKTEKKKRQRQNKKLRDSNLRLERIISELHETLDHDDYKFILNYIKRGYAWSLKSYAEQQEAYRTFSLMLTSVELGESEMISEDEFDQNEPYDSETNNFQPISDYLERSPEFEENEIFDDNDEGYDNVILSNSHDWTARYE